MIEMAPHLLGAAIDSETADWIREYHSRKRVDVLTNASMDGFIGENGRVKAVQLQDGKLIPADLVVIGVGIIPNTELAEQAGLKVDNGILVNESLSTSSDGIYAAGDVARFYSPIFKRNLRVEHVDVAQRQGKVAGINMTGGRTAFDELPYFFSNQFDLEINAYGDLTKHTAIFRRGKMSERTGFIQFYFEGASLNGILSVNADWNDIEMGRSLLSLRKNFSDPSIVADESKTLRSITKSMRSF
jgi:3-phenylpropionate/trans-cinnamate dioxygenase ferredoxin reductase subunit